MPIISRSDQLPSLLTARPSFLPGGSVRLRLPELDELERGQWEKRLSDLRGACGCKSGAVSLLAFLALCGLLAGTGVVGVTPLKLALLLPGAFVAGAAGKLGGLLVSRIRLRRTVAMLRRRLG